MHPNPSAGFSDLERCAAFVAARTTLTSVQRAARGWPSALADPARRAAASVVDVTAEAAAQRHASREQRRSLREALRGAIHVVDTIDRARGLGYDDAELDDLQRVAGRSVALLGMFLHANTSAFP
ncbi:MAG TPA: hypothetical protein VGC42_00370 [Kofleriaceae bacterium]